VKHLHLIFCVLLGLLPAAGVSLAGTAPADNDQVRAAIEKLKATIDISAAQEQPRIGKRDDGFLRFFGAPPGAPAQLNPALRAASPEEKAVGFLTEHDAAFGVDSEAISFAPRRIKTDGDRTFVRLSQLYFGIPVFSGEITVHLGKTGVECILADLMTTRETAETEPVPVTPSIDAGQAEKTSHGHSH